MLRYRRTSLYILALVAVTALLRPIYSSSALPWLCSQNSGILDNVSATLLRWLPLSWLTRC